MTTPAAQTLPTLTHHFAIPGVLAFREEHGLLFADISTPAATATLCLQGAHLTHWRPVGQESVIFLSQRSDMAPGKAIRGGIPLLFPWFGPCHDGHEGPAHGFARIQPWQLDFAALSGQDLHLTLTQTPTDLSRSLGFDHFRLAYQITLGKALRLQLTVANDGAEPLLYEEGMHTYFAVQDVHEIAIEGLDGTHYIDKKDEFKVKPQTAGAMHITEPTDRVYLNTTSTCTIHDAAFHRTITIAKENSRNTVVWNPWAEMTDIHPNGWHEFVCVETVNVGEQSITLNPRTDPHHAIHHHCRLMLILASASPRRRELLSQIGLTFQVDPADVNEAIRAGEPADEYVSRIAEAKARVVFDKHRGEGAIVLGADTCVLLEGKILGKPSGREDARSMLRSLSGRTHQVLTGVCVVSEVGAAAAVEVTQVTFNLVDSEEFERYLETEEPLDKAGAYGIQGYAARWIPRVEGCYFNVVGLPLARTTSLLTNAAKELVRQ